MKAIKRGYFLISFLFIGWIFSCSSFDFGSFSKPIYIEKLLFYIDEKVTYNLNSLSGYTDIVRWYVESDKGLPPHLILKSTGEIEAITRYEHLGHTDKDITILGKRLEGQIIYIRFDVSYFYRKGELGTSDSPFLINNIDDFKLIEKFSSSIYSLTRSINFGGVNHIPIGSSLYPFKGTFRGNNFQLYNFNINAINLDNVPIGFFSSISKGTVENLRMSNIQINNIPNGHSLGVGTLSGEIREQTDIRNTEVTQITINQNQVNNIGGIVGIGLSSSVSFTRAIDNINLLGAQSVGGIAGSGNQLSISFSFVLNDGNIETVGNRVGGIVGNLQFGLLHNNYSITRVVTGLGTLFGGIVGEDNGSGISTSFFYPTWVNGNNLVNATAKGSSIALVEMSDLVNYKDFNSRWTMLGTLSRGYLAGVTQLPYPNP